MNRKVNEHSISPPSDSDTDRVGFYLKTFRIGASLFDAHKFATFVLIALIGTYLGFKNFGLTPIHMIGRLTGSNLLARRWTKVCYYGIYNRHDVNVELLKGDLEQIVTDSLSASCDFTIIEGYLDDTKREFLKKTGVPFNLKTPGPQSGTGK